MAVVCVILCASCVLKISVHLQKIIFMLNDTLSTFLVMGILGYEIFVGDQSGCKLMGFIFD